MTLRPVAIEAEGRGPQRDGGANPAQADLGFAVAWPLQT